MDPFKNYFDVGFMVYDWEDLYGEVQEDLPENAPESRKHSVTMAQFLDANHAGNIINLCSNTVILIYLFRDPNIWYIKNQNTV